MTVRENATAAGPAEAIAGLSRCLSAGDLNGALAYYEPRAVFQAAPEGPAVSGVAAIRPALEAFLALKPTLTGEIQRVLEADGIALVVNRWRLEGTGPDGEPIEMGGTSADVLRQREDGAWGILVDDPWGSAR
jgi:ketosteroid isomerase-like protein